MWIIEEAGPKSAFWNMEADRKQLESVLVDSPAVLRFYEWEASSITYGYFVDPEELFDMEAVKTQKLDIARRPTGGGVIFHQQDLAFSIVVPSSHPFYSMNSLLSYQIINSHILEAIKKVVPSKDLLLQDDLKEAPRGGFCMAKATKYDLILEGKKVGGAAQRKTKNGLLHQSSLFLGMPDSAWLHTILKSGSQASSHISETSLALGEHLRRDLKSAILEEIGEFIYG